MRPLPLKPEALDVCKTENPTRDTTHGGACREASGTVCRKRPFTTRADRLRSRLKGGRLPVAGPAARRAAGRRASTPATSISKSVGRIFPGALTVSVWFSASNKKSWFPPARRTLSSRPTRRPCAVSVRRQSCRRFGPVCQAMRQPAPLPRCHRPSRTGPGPLAARPADSPRSRSLVSLSRVKGHTATR